MMRSRTSVIILLIIVAAALFLASFALNDYASSEVAAVQAISPTATAAPTVTLAPVWTFTATMTPTLSTSSGAEILDVSVPPTELPWVCPHWRGVTERNAFYSTHMGETINYLVHLPPCYDQFPQSAFPVLYLLHGWPLNEYHWVQIGVTELLDDWVSRGLSGPFILVLPGVTNSNGRYVHSSGGSGSFEGMLVEELLPQIEAEYRVWQVPEGRAIGGISRGGIWSLEIGMRNPQLFMSVGGHSPALSVNTPPRVYDPFYLAQTGLPGQRVYLDTGDADWTRGGTQQLRDVLLEHGAQVVYETHPGAHIDELWSGALPSYLAFYSEIWPTQVMFLPQWDPPEPEQAQTP